MNNNTIDTISRARPPIHSDFEALRAEGIRHLEELATHIWTDFNAHDPGITILEVLCYALTDLGYRVSLPLEDLLAAPPNEQQSSAFFPASMTLSNRPITPLDYRKLLIDIPAVKNAWLEKTGGEIQICKEGAAYKQGSIEDFLKKHGFWLTEDAAEADNEQRVSSVVLYLTQPELELQFFNEAEARKLKKLLHCEYWECGELKIKDKNSSGTPIDLNGLYKIKLELHDPNLALPKAAAKAAIEKAKATLYDNRNLCEDFVEVCLVETQKICFCLHIEVAPTADAKDVMAEAMFKIQEFLSPTPKFYSLSDLLEEGLAGDEIYDGPTLNHGFLKDEELASSELRATIYVSDLYNLLSEIPEIVTIKELEWKFENETKFKSGWCIETETPVKFIADVCCSQMYVSKGVGTKAIKITEADIEEQLEIKYLIQRTVLDDGFHELEIPQGRYRPDLADYTSIQHEFPRTYYLGDEALPDSVGAERKAQAKQLQAYLLFFDRILANYLQHLSQVREVFSLTQDKEDDTVFFQALGNIPGITELLDIYPGLHARIVNLLVAEVEKSIEKEAFKEEEGQALKDAIKNAIDVSWESEAELDDFKTGLLQIVQGQTGVNSLRKKLDNYLYSQESYEQHLAKIALGEDSNLERKNQLLDHLLARFGVQFSTYVLELYQSASDENSEQAYEDFLCQKMDFLRQVNTLSSERAKAYNYALFKAERPEPDVWNTSNVSGLKKRVSGLLNLPATTASTFCDPPYQIKLVKDRTKKRAAYLLQLIQLGDDENEAKALLLSEGNYTKKTAEELRKRLYQQLGIKGVVEVKAVADSDGLAQVKYRNEEIDIQLSSSKMGLGEAENLKETVEKLLDPASCDKNGFHIVEHILLRPNDDRDQLMQAINTCEKDCIEPYSFWISVIIPAWTKAAQTPNYRYYFEQTFLAETPAHIAVCFRWVEKEEEAWLRRFENAFEHWREAFADCKMKERKDECKVTATANDLIEILAELPCPCCCDEAEGTDSICEDC